MINVPSLGNGISGTTDTIDAHLDALTAALDDFRAQATRLARWGEQLADVLNGGGRLLTAGNGGSAAEAQHLAAELVGKMSIPRRAVSAIALTADTASLTALGNDYGYQQVFARQVQAHGRPGDVLLALSSSGYSPNVLAAVEAASEIGMIPWSFTGPAPNPLAASCYDALTIPSSDTQIVQELHLVAVHQLCAQVDAWLFERLRCFGEQGGGCDMNPGPLVIVGDTFLDRNVVGKAERLCPDAPAPVLEQADSRERPGGAGLASVFAAADGRETVLIAAIGDDEVGRRLAELLAEAEVRLIALPHRGPTTEKIRLCAGHQVLMRWDRGSARGPLGAFPDEAREAIAEADGILVSDYGQGVATDSAIRSALAARAPSIATVWDPHPHGAQPVSGMWLVTPNQREVAQLGQGYSSCDDVSVAGVVAEAERPAANEISHVSRHAEALRRRWGARAVAVTLGDRGALLCCGDTAPLLVPVPRSHTSDTCGAGDRFAATMLGSLSAGAVISEAVAAGVTAASDYVGTGGVSAALRGRHTKRSVRDSATSSGEGGLSAARAVIARVRTAGGTVVATGGCFDLLHAGHIATLQTARALGDCLVVCLNSDGGVRRRKGVDRPVVGESDRARVLQALECVDVVVVFDEETPEVLLSELRPDIWVKGGDYFGAGACDGPPLPEAALLRQWGGQAVIVPYLDGRSTTNLLARARA